LYRARAARPVAPFSSQMERGNPVRFSTAKSMPIKQNVVFRKKLLTEMDGKDSEKKSQQ
jgi:hypothetical protein